MRARRLLATVPALIALTAVAGCEKPTPLVTVVSGGTSVHTEAAIYCREGQSVEQQNCRNTGAKAAELRVTPGKPVGIDVSRPLATSGWYLAVGTQRISDVRKDHYLSVTPGQQDFGEQGRIELQIRSVEGEGESARNTGLWLVSLVCATCPSSS